MDIQNRIASLRQIMLEKGIDAYIISSADYHQSEYVGDYFKAREFISGFTGSAGTVVITKEEACLWTDGRYFLQAKEQLHGSKIHLQKMGEPNVPTILEYLEHVLGNSCVIGINGRTFGIKEAHSYEELAKKKGGKLLYQYDLVQEIWLQRPSLSKKPAFLLKEEYTGESTESKLTRIRKTMNELGANVHLLTSLDDIGWILNIRGQDVEYFPLLLSYAIITMDSVELYADKEKFNTEILEHFAKHCVNIHPYEQVYLDVRNFSPKTSILIDTERVNYMLYRELSGEMQIITAENPSIKMKCIKNHVEVENLRKCHVMDGIACTKFMYWLKTHPDRAKINELDAAKKLDFYRKQHSSYISQSFDPICAYREHGAIVHYSATEETALNLKGSGLFLADTGGNYYEGSTDITRTIALGEVTEQEKRHFTLVAASMLRLGDAKFLYGCNGMSLDYAAREPFWRQNLNFNHGTGHGVGYLGNIHEPPIGFRWRSGGDVMCPFEEGMIITDEPGLYIAGEYGIRIENILLVCKGEKNQYGQFMYFEPLTLVPIDLDAIVPEQLTEYEINLLNAYHKRVYDTLSPFLEKQERIWLKEYTKPIELVRRGNNCE